ncbi:MAG: CBS domain-containing protein [Planctomycetes bacterium]|nr:CBS domain-containing protein [Planctomycetota bacterium]
MLRIQHILDKKNDDVATIGPNATVLDAARLMNQQHIGALPVTRRDKIVGILTERDILNRVVAVEHSPAETIIKDVMTTPVACCRRDTQEPECRAVMRKKRIRHLPVVEDGHLVGMISIGDIIEDDNAEKDETIHYLHEYLYGNYH